MSKWNMIIDVAECTNCNLCTLAASDEYVDNAFPGYAAPMPKHGHKWIDILQNERGQGTQFDIAYVPTMCNHCDDAPCVKAGRDGAVKKRWYHAGSFLNAALDKASLENERNALWLRTRGGADVTCVQVAGLVARRILCYVGEGAELARGQRYGFIRFGSRVDVYLPPDAEPRADRKSTRLNSSHRT